jgi:hypothetical protein
LAPNKVAEAEPFLNRQGCFATIQDWIFKVLGEMGPDPERGAEACLVLAMAQHESNQADEARATLAKALEILDTRTPKLED